MTKNVKLSLLLVFILYASAFVWLSGTTSENYLMVRAFDSDESGVLAVIQRMYIENVYEPITYNYGTAHIYFTMGLVRTLELFKEINFKDYAYAGRFINFISLFGVVFLFIKFGSISKYGKWLVLYVFTILFVGLNFRYSLNAKPEHLQSFFVVFSIFSLQYFINKKIYKYIVIAGFFCGAAFSTKYIGLLLIFFESSFVFFYSLYKKDSLSNFSFYLNSYFALFFGFLCGSFVFGPFLVINYDITLNMLDNLSQVTRSGFVFHNDDSYIRWFEVIFGYDVLWFGFLFITLFCMIYLLYKKISIVSVFEEINMVGFFWSIFCLLYVILFSNVIAERYLIVVLPFLLESFFIIYAYLEKNFKDKRNLIAANLLVFFVSAAVIFSAGGSFTRSFIDLVDRDKSPQILASRWLSENVHKTQLIAFDLYTYVPPEFKNIFHENYLDAYSVASISPDYIVTSREIMSRYIHKDKAEKFTAGKEEYFRHYLLYSNLNKNTLPGFVLVKDFGGVLIFKNTMKS